MELQPLRANCTNALGISLGEMPGYGLSFRDLWVRRVELYAQLLQVWLRLIALKLGLSTLRCEVGFIKVFFFFFLTGFTFQFTFGLLCLQQGPLTSL